MSRWREWPRLRGVYALQATVSDLLAVAVGVLIGWRFL